MIGALKQAAREYAAICKINPRTPLEASRKELDKLTALEKMGAAAVEFDKTPKVSCCPGYGVMGRCCNQ